MHNYIVRVELVHPHDYTAFYEVMARRGFVKIIRGDGGSVWDLPAGVYYISTWLSAEQVRALVLNVLAELGYVAKVLVVQCGDVAWSGLDVHHPVLEALRRRVANR